MQIPEELKREELSLAEAMMRIQESTSFPRGEVEQLVALLPNPLAASRAFLCSLDGQWRYEFGEPYTVETSAVVGTDQNPEVRILLCGLLKLARLASCSDLKRYISRLSNKRKHFDHLAELDPVLRAKELVHLVYEPRPLGEEAPGPDWAMYFADTTECLVEVKSRIKELLSLFAGLRSGTDPSPHANRMPVLPSLLKDVSRKFPSLDEISNSLQGVWVYSPVWFIREELLKVFDGCDPAKVRFLVIGRAWREYEALASDDQNRRRLIQHFSLPGV